MECLCVIKIPDSGGWDLFTPIQAGALRTVPMSIGALAPFESHTPENQKNIHKCECFLAKIPDSGGGIRTHDQLITLVFLFPKRVDYIIPASRRERRGEALPSPISIGPVLPKGDSLYTFSKKSLPTSLFKREEAICRSLARDCPSTMFRVSPNSPRFSTSIT